MTTVLSTAAPARVGTDLLVVPVCGPPAEHADLRALDRALNGRLLAEVRRQGFTGKADQELLFHTHDRLPARAVLLVGGGTTPAPRVWYQLADALARCAGKLRAQRAAVALGADRTVAAAAAVSEGVALARYRFTRFRSRPEAQPELRLTLLVATADAAHRRAVATAAISAAAVCLARDLANAPAAVMTPTALAREARRIAGSGLTVRVYDRRGIGRLKMGGLLAVAQGSAQPPAFIALRYRPPGRPRRRVALVGKGITFDSGGLSLKPPESMQLQKRDMAGAAVLLAAMSALPALRYPIEVYGYIPAAENMPSGTALRPGDVVRACNGTTIEVLNTDAEGRLILADALSYAAARRPQLILDFATLTAAVRTALGPRCAAIMGSDAALVRDCIDAAAEADERLWELPLLEEYRRDIDSRVADLRNVGEGYAGTIIGGLFLREFTGGVPWAHVDFSSTVMSDGYVCHPKGASGFGVRTVLRLIERWSTQRV